MSEESPLTRIAITCAAIVLGTVFVGAQLSTSGGLSRVASTVADEEDGDAAEPAVMSTDDELVEEDIEEDADKDSTDDESDQYAREGDASSEDGTGEQTAEATQEEAEEEGGFTAVRRNP